MGALRAVAAANAVYLRRLRRKFLPPLLKAACMHAIIFYQKYLSLHTPVYYPTCSQYTLECINNYGALAGIAMGMWRILRCNPFSKGGYDPVPEKFWQLKWLI